MGKHIDAELEALILQLQKENLEELKLFIEFLLERQKEKKQKRNGEKRKLLEGLTRIPVPLKDAITDRSIIYEDRI